MKQDRCEVPQSGLTCTQALKTLKSVKGSPWSLSSGLRAVAQSRLLWALRVNGDWTLRAAAMVSTGSARLNMEPRISIFPVGSRGRVSLGKSALCSGALRGPDLTSSIAHKEPWEPNGPTLANSLWFPISPLEVTTEVATSVLQLTGPFLVLAETELALTSTSPPWLDFLGSLWPQFSSPSESCTQPALVCAARC